MSDLLKDKTMILPLIFIISCTLAALATCVIGIVLLLKFDTKSGSSVTDVLLLMIPCAVFFVFSIILFLISKNLVKKIFNEVSIEKQVEYYIKLVGATEDPNKKAEYIQIAWQSIAASVSNEPQP